MKLSIEGYTDSTGSDETNRKLSSARADSVKAFLTEMGVSPSIMKAQGFGPDKPLMPNDTPEGRAKNRRVEIVMINASLMRAERRIRHLHRRAFRYHVTIGGTHRVTGGRMV